MRFRPATRLRQGASVTEKYEFIDAEYATYRESRQHVPSIVQMCEWLEVSRSGFYEWRIAPESARQREGASCSKLYDQGVYSRIPTGRTGTGGSTRTWPAGAWLPARSWSAGSCASWAWSPASRGRGGVQPAPRATARARHPRPREPRLHRGRARRENGRRHYLHFDLGGLALPGDGHRLRTRKQ